MGFSIVDYLDKLLQGPASPPSIHDNIDAHNNNREEYENVPGFLSTTEACHAGRRNNKL